MAASASRPGDVVDACAGHACVDVVDACAVHACVRQPAATTCHCLRRAMRRTVALTVQASAPHRRERSPAKRTWLRGGVGARAAPAALDRHVRTRRAWGLRASTGARVCRSRRRARGPRRRQWVCLRMHAAATHPANRAVGAECTRWAGCSPTADHRAHPAGVAAAHGVHARHTPPATGPHAMGVGCASLRSPAAPPQHRGGHAARPHRQIQVQERVPSSVVERQHAIEQHDDVDRAQQTAAVTRATRDTRQLKNRSQ